MRQALSAGDFRCVLGDAEVRRLFLKGTVVLDRLYFAVRGPDWATLDLDLGRPAVEESEAGWSATVNGQCPTNSGGLEISLSFAATTGSFQARVSCTASADTEVNRIGFCLLHPMAVAGLPVQVRAAGVMHADHFPQSISPTSPFTDMNKMSFRISGFNVEFVFAGDPFETEDQRNWIDASFKTFSTPLSAPRPWTLRAGTLLEQMVTMRWVEEVEEVDDEGASKTVTTPRRESAGGTAPSIGIGASRSHHPLRQQSIDLLSEIDISWLAVTLDVGLEWERRWQRAVVEAEALRVPLDVSIVVADGGIDVGGLSRLLTGVPVVRLHGYDRSSHLTTRSITESLCRIRDLTGRDIRIAGGSRANFAELNRAGSALPLDLLDEVVFAANPQVHAFDGESIAETPAALEIATAQAVNIAKGRPVLVAPLTFRPMFNAATPGSVTVAEPTADERQHREIAATWAREALAATQRAAGVTVYESYGAWGIIDDAGRPTPSYGTLCRSRPRRGSA